MQDSNFLNENNVNARLAASFVHGIRNPITSIKMRLYSISRLDLPEASKDDLAVVSEEIAVIQHLAQNFLEFSNPRKLNPQVASPSEVVDKALRLLKPEFENRNIRLNLCRRRPLPELFIDTERLKEALVNLITNSTEAIKNGKGIISIVEKEVTHTILGPSVEIDIFDNGNGLSEFVEGRIFTPFFSTKPDGTGLGLCIAKQIVEAHNGKLAFTSIENIGSLFTMTLPITRQ